MCTNTGIVLFFFLSFSHNSFYLGMVLEKIYNSEMRDFLDTRKEKSATKKSIFLLNAIKVS